MKKSTVSVIVIVVIIIVGIIVFGRSSSSPTPPTDVGTASSTNPLAQVPASQTTQVSSKTSKYVSAELGFSLDYPTAWEADKTDTGVTFIMPIDQAQVSTVAKLEADVNVVGGKCAFPPVTTIQDRGTLPLVGATADMISMTNTVQGRGYFNRMYSLQHGNICYLFTFSSITLSAANKGLTGSNVTQAQNNNKAILNAADADFTNLVKTFAFVQGPAGEDETKASPAK